MLLLGEEPSPQRGASYSDPSVDEPRLLARAALAGSMGAAAKPYICRMAYFFEASKASRGIHYQSWRAGRGPRERASALFHVSQNSIEPLAHGMHKNLRGLVCLPFKADPFPMSLPSRALLAR